MEVLNESRSPDTCPRSGFGTAAGEFRIRPTTAQVEYKQREDSTIYDDFLFGNGGLLGKNGLYDSPAS